MAVTYLVGASFGRRAPSGVTLVLAGVAVVSLRDGGPDVHPAAQLDVVREVYQWILGRLSTATWSDVRLVLPYVAVSASC